MNKKPIVDIVAPAFKCDLEHLKNGIRLIESWGLQARVPEDLFDENSLYSQEDPVRFSRLKKALTARDSDLVWCVRGGFGSIRLIPDLLKLKKPKKQKILIGLSDITTLHLFLNQVWKWPSIHGPMLDRLGSKPPDIQFINELQKLIMGDEQKIEFLNLKPLNKIALKTQVISSTVTGGNLITLHSSIKTKIEWKTQGKILFLEELGERAYRIDRVMEHFDQIGLWKKPKALILGDFTHCLEPDGNNLFMKVLETWAKGVKFPVYTGIQSGHDLIQRPVPFGTKAILYTGPEAKLVCQFKNPILMGG